MSTNDVVAALAATRTAPGQPAVPALHASAGAHQSAPSPQSANQPPAAQQPGGAPAPAVPGTAAAVTVAEAALRRALAAGNQQDPHAFAIDLLRSVEALLHASAPVGMSPDDIGAAAARLVERQGLLARFSEAPPSGTWPTGVGPDDLTPKALDTRL